jgi:hypothetical protein
MNMNRERAQLLSIRGSHRRRNRWYGPGLSGCMDQSEIFSALRKQAVDWNKVLGLATVLVVVVLGWTVVGIAVSHFLR